MAAAMPAAYIFSSLRHGRGDHLQGGTLAQAVNGPPHHQIEVENESAFKTIWWNLPSFLMDLISVNECNKFPW